MFEKKFTNAWNESVIQVPPAGFRTKRRKLPPNGANYRQSGLNRNTGFFQLYKWVSYVKGLCQRQSLYAWCRGFTRSRLSKKSGPKSNFCERLECCMLKAGSLWTLFDAAVTFSRQRCWKSRIRVWSPLIGRCGGWGWDNIENTETAFFFGKKSFLQQSSECIGQNGQKNT